MKALQLVILTFAAAGVALAADVQEIVPEVGLDGPSIVGALGLLTGGLLIIRARRK